MNNKGDNMATKGHTFKPQPRRPDVCETCGKMQPYHSKWWIRRVIYRYFQI